MLEEMLNNFMVYLTEASHLLSLSAILICATFTFFFIVHLIRQDLLHIEGAGGITHVSRSPPPQLAMMKIPLPFHIELASAKDLSFDNVKLKISSEKPWQVGLIRQRLFIGVSIPIFHHVLKSPWPWLTEAFEHGNIFGSEGSLEMTDVIETVINEDSNTVVLERSSSADINLGSETPRQRYPLVICSMPGADFSQNSENIGQIGAVFSVLHIQDEVCKFPTRILSTHLKHFDSTTTIVGSIFVSGNVDDTETGNKCVVCQDSEVTRVLFPCRHACVCGRCFSKLKDQCPMCRALVTSYFLMDNGEEESEEDDDDLREDITETLNWRQRLVNLNRNFAAAMGLQENN